MILGVRSLINNDWLASSKIPKAERVGAIYDLDGKQFHMTLGLERAIAWGDTMAWGDLWLGALSWQAATYGLGRLYGMGRLLAWGVYMARGNF